MSINIYKNWDPSKGDYVDENLELERVQRKKDKLKAKVQTIIFSVIFFGLIVFSVWYALRAKR
ncbi:MAG: hypothetical protein JSS63_12860 [Bacteroidetes bacterium]|nr:hypothetical protein [Bacteroidota bacterium]MBX7046252.1 hypothetical protein [Ignavibacteria bacterium]